MPDSLEPNPLEYKIFYICESPLSKCSTLPLPSRITIEHSGGDTGILSKDAPAVAGYTKTGPMTLLEIKQYVNDQTTQFYIQSQLAQTCNDAGLDSKNGTGIPPACTSAFKNFSALNLQNIQMTHKNFDTPFSTQFSTGLNPFMNFTYTQQYIASKSTDNDKKELCQRYADIGQLLKDFSFILTLVDNNEVKSAYTDHYEAILALYNKNNQLRTHLTNKFDYLTQGVYSHDAKQFLDSTTYVNVLLTILATIGVFYLIKKM